MVSAVNTLEVRRAGRTSARARTDPQRQMGKEEGSGLRRTLLWFISLIAIVLSACVLAPSSEATPEATSAATTPSVSAATSRPSTSPQLRTPRPLPAPTPPELVLSYERFSDIPTLRGPELLLTSDAQLLTPNGGNELDARRLSPQGIDRVRRAVLDTGLFTATRSVERRLRPGASPNVNRGFEWLRITVRVDGQDVAVSTFARDHEDALYVWDAGREELLVLAARLSDLSWLPTSAWADSTPRPYDAVFHRLYIETLRSAAQPALPATVESFWPFATPTEGFGVTVPPDSAWPSTLTARCTILAADDARALGEPIARWAGTSYSRNMRVTSGSFQWAAGNGEIYLQLEPLLPHVMPTCDGVRRAA